MAETFLGEIMLFPFGYAPKDWALCDGRLLSVKDNQALFSVLGNAFGGDGKKTFALPDLQGRAPVHPSTTGALPIKRGAKGGTEAVALTPAQLPQHTHQVSGENSLANSANPLLRSTMLWSKPATPTPPIKEVSINPFSSGTPNVQMDPSIIESIGGGQEHSNMQPFLVLNFCICVQGVYPPKP